MKKSLNKIKRKNLRKLMYGIIINRGKHTGTDKVYFDGYVSDFKKDIPRLSKTK